MNTTTRWLRDALTTEFDFSQCWLKQMAEGRTVAGGGLAVALGSTFAAIMTSRNATKEMGKSGKTT